MARLFPWAAEWTAMAMVKELKMRTTVLAAPSFQSRWPAASAKA